MLSVVQERGTEFSVEFMFPIKCMLKDNFKNIEIFYGFLREQSASNSLLSQ